MRIAKTGACVAWLLAATGALGACRGRDAAASTPPAGSPTTPIGGPLPLSAAALVGRALFFDQALSASGQMSCATCHDPDHAYAPANGDAVQPGGPSGAGRGIRAVPSLRYKEYTPPYADLFDNPDGISAPGPGGGFAWDGRASTLAQQARLPLLSPVEMANASAAAVVGKVQAAPYADAFAGAFPELRFTDTDAAFAKVLAALEAFQREDVSFHPYTSKFDRHADNKIGGTFTAAEARGFRVFIDEKTGNCAACHYVGPGLNGSSGLFTDFSYEAIGVPRNREIPANTDDEFFDLGLCGPARTDHLPSGRPSNEFCGLFKTPTLRNVATRGAFFHNGAMHSLEQAVRFYATRDTMPELWYPTVGGSPKARPDAAFPRYGLITAQFSGGVVRKFDDLPPRHRANLDVQRPLDGRPRGSKPPLGEREIADLLCFLETLTDGYQPPPTPPVSGPCVE
ncbi:MAG TPA: cytochrome c peroxidase [Polyangia bacterium]|jgi:cytochrome c peroxidase|nr:cytochrome c peroxidase [Polyangia bacterium]